MKKASKTTSSPAPQPSRPHLLPDGLRRWFCEGWYDPANDPTSNDRKYIMSQNFTATTISTLVNGNFWIGLLLEAGADDGFFGLLPMITQFCSFFQLFVPLLLERFRYRKKLLLCCRVSIYILDIILMALLPRLPFDRAVRLTAIAINTGVIALLNTVWGNGANAWHIPFVTAKTRNSYFAICNMLVTVISSVVGLAGSSIADAFEAAGLKYEGLLLLRAIALGVAVAEHIFHRRISEVPNDQSSERIHLKDVFLLPLRNKPFMIMVGAMFLYNLACAVPVNYYTVYLMNELNVSYTFIYASQLSAVPVYLFLSRPMSRWTRNWRTLDKVWQFMLLLAIHWLNLSLVTKYTLWIFPATTLYGYIINVGLGLGTSRLMLDNLPESRQSTFIAFYLTVASIATVIGTAIGRTFVLNTQTLSYTLLGLPMGGKQSLEIFSAACVILCAFVVRCLSAANERLKASSSGGTPTSN